MCTCLPEKNILVTLNPPAPKSHLWASPDRLPHSLMQSTVGYHHPLPHVMKGKFYQKTRKLERAVRKAAMSKRDGKAQKVEEKRHKRGHTHVPISQGYDFFFFLCVKTWEDIWSCSWFQITSLCCVNMWEWFSDLRGNCFVFLSRLEMLSNFSHLKIIGYRLPLFKMLTSKIFAQIWRRKDSWT